MVMTEKTPRPLLVANNVKKSFDKVNALNGVTLTLFEGDQYVIRGASGCGKSTLLYLMGGLDRPTSGSVVVNGQDLSQYDDDALAKFRNTFTGLVFQFHFLPQFFFLYQICYGATQVFGHFINNGIAFGMHGTII